MWGYDWNLTPIYRLVNNFLIKDNLRKVQLDLFGKHLKEKNYHEISKLKLLKDILKFFNTY